MKSFYLFLLSCTLVAVAAAQDLVPFQDAKKLFGFKDKSGKVIVPPRFSAITHASEGMIAVREGDKWGYLNAKGTMAIQPQFDEAHGFSQGKAAVGKVMGERKTMLLGYINLSGTVIIDYQWDIANNFHNGFAIIGMQASGGDSYFAVINRKGERKFPGAYTAIEDISEGLFLVAQGSVLMAKAKYGFVDSTGKQVVPFIYQNGMSFYEGLASVQKDGKWGFIDKKNKVVIPFQFDGPGFFEKGKAEVTKDGVSIKINKAGKTVK
jgi:hypothetical protein